MRMARGTFGLLLALLACTNTAEKTPEEQVVAMVGGVPVSVEEFQRELARLRIDQNDTLISATTASMQKRTLIENLIERKLVLREAEAQNVLVGIDEVEAEFERMKRAWPGTEFEENLKERDVTPAELKREIRTLLTVRRFFRDHVFPRVAVTDEEVEDYLEAHPEIAVAPEQVRARHIVVQTEEKAKEVLKEIKHGLPFEEAAMQYSKSPEGKSGGELGFFERGEMPRIFDDVCFGAKREGVVDQVVASDYGFHLFKVVEKRPETARPLELVRQEIEALLLEKKQRDMQVSFVQKLREATPIEIKENRLASIY